MPLPDLSALDHLGEACADGGRERYMLGGEPALVWAVEHQDTGDLTGPSDRGGEYRPEPEARRPPPVELLGAGGGGDAGVQDALQQRGNLVCASKLLPGVGTGLAIGELGHRRHQAPIVEEEQCRAADAEVAGQLSAHGGERGPVGPLADRSQERREDVRLDALPLRVTTREDRLDAGRDDRADVGPRVELLQRRLDRQDGPDQVGAQRMEFERR